MNPQKKQAAAGGKPAPDRTGRFVQALVFLLGVAVLVVEILGTRVIAPYYGSSVYCWSALITVTLASLALGYMAGGVWADRRPDAGLYFWETIASGVLVLAIPLFKTPVLSATAGLGLALGSLTGAALLFAPSLFMMGTTGPLAVRLVTAEYQALGRGAGKVYALSTAGSVAGALLTGFLLVPHFGVRQILAVTGLSLAALGALGLLSIRRGGSAVLPLAAALAMAAPPFFSAAPAAANIVLNRPSFYGEIRVVDIPGDLRVLFLDGISHGCIHKDSGEPQPDYLYYLELPAHLRPGARRALVIGLGAGSVPLSYGRRHGMETDAVEIDPAVASAAASHFGFVPSGRVAVEDGRTFLARGGAPYDIVVLDAFSSDHIPFHLFTREFFELVRARLTPGGVLAVNTLGEPSRRQWISVHKTLAAVFPHIAGHYTEAGHNMIFLASAEPFPASVDLSGARPASRPALERMLARRLPPPSGDELAAALVFTDDYNPIDKLYKDVLMDWRKAFLATSKEFLLSDAEAGE